MVFPFRLYKISGHSMEPTITRGSLVLVYRGVKNLNAHDIIAFMHESKILIKRITSIRNGAYEVIGDNIHSSQDSNTFGLVAHASIIGKVIWH